MRDVCDNKIKVMSLFAPTIFHYFSLRAKLPSNFQYYLHCITSRLLLWTRLTKLNISHTGTSN